MVGTIPNLATRARREYSKRGLLSLITSGVRFVAKDFWIEILIRRRSISRSELKKIAADDGGIWYLEKEDPVVIEPPSNPELRKEFEPFLKKYTPERPFVCELRDCRLVGYHGSEHSRVRLVGVKKNHRPVLETTAHSQERMSEDYIIKNFKEHFDPPWKRLVPSSLKSEPKQREERVFLLVPWYLSYCHWVVEDLPKLRLLEHYVKMTGNKPKILVEPEPRDFIKESVEAFGYGPDWYEGWSGKETQVSNLVIPMHKPSRFDLFDYTPPQKDLKWLHRRISSNTDSGHGSRNNRRIYVSRQKVDDTRASSRKVVNYDEMMDVLNDFGFESYLFEDMSFKEQVKAVRDSEVIMGPHGAGLVNMVFADDPLIIEMFPENALKPHFYFIADMMGFDYEPILTEANGTNLVVDARSLRSRLDSVLD